MREQEAYLAVAELIDPLREFAALDAGERAALLEKLRGFAHDAPLRAQVAELDAATAPDVADARAAAVIDAFRHMSR